MLDNSTQITAASNYARGTTVHLLFPVSCFIVLRQMRRALPIYKCTFRTEHHNTILQGGRKGTLYNPKASDHLTDTADCFWHTWVRRYSELFCTHSDYFFGEELNISQWGKDKRSCTSESKGQANSFVNLCTAIIYVICFQNKLNKTFKLNMIDQFFTCKGNKIK